MTRTKSPASILIAVALLAAACASGSGAGPVARTGGFGGHPILCSPVPGWLAAALDLGLEMEAEHLAPSLREGSDLEAMARADHELRHLSASESRGVWYVSGHVRGPGFGAVDAIGTWAVGSLDVPGPIHAGDYTGIILSRFEYGPLPHNGEPGFDAEGVQESRDCSRAERKLAEGY